MKNSPEKNEFRELENRLRNYSEQPGADLWGKIQTGMGQGDRVAGAGWKIRTAIGVAAVLLSTGIYFGYQQWNASGKNIQRTNADKSVTDQNSGVEENNSKIESINPGENKSTQQSQTSATDRSGSEAGNSDAGKSTQRAQPSETDQPGKVTANSDSDETPKQNRSAATVNLKDILKNVQATRATTPAAAEPSDTNNDKTIKGTQARKSNQTNEEPERNHVSMTMLKVSVLNDNPAVGESVNVTALNPTQVTQASTVEQPSELLNAAENKSTQNIIDLQTSETLSGASTGTTDLKSATPVSDSTLAAKPKEVKKQVEKKSTIPKIKSLPKQKVITIYGLLTPSLSFLSVTPHANDNVSVREFQNPSIVSSDRIGLSFDAGIQGEINSRLSYIAGLSFYHQAQTLHYKEFKAGSNFVTGDYNDFNYTINPSTVDQSMRYTMTNAGLQAGLLYTLKDNAHLKHRIGLLLQYQKGFSHTTGEYNNAGSQYLNYQIVYRVEFPVKPKLKFMFQPMFVSPITTNESLHAPFDLKQFKAGIGFGFIYKLSSGKDVSGIHYKGE